MHLIGFIIRINHDLRSSECQCLELCRPSSHAQWHHRNYFTILFLLVIPIVTLPLVLRYCYRSETSFWGPIFWKAFGDPHFGKLLANYLPYIFFNWRPFWGSGTCHIRSFDDKWAISTRYISSGSTISPAMPLAAFACVPKYLKQWYKKCVNPYTSVRTTR